MLNIFCLFFLSFSMIFGNTEVPPPGPMRTDALAVSSPGVLIKLARADSILRTLTPHPENYHLMLSSKSSFGGEAVPPYVFSDKPTMILYQGALAPARSDEEIAFMMAHELGHLVLDHAGKMGAQMEKIFNGPPVGISGTTFAIFYQKLQEREADLFGLNLYKEKGYDLEFFPYTLNLIRMNPNIHFGSNNLFKKERSSLSMQDSHFCMKERFELLTAMR